MDDCRAEWQLFGVTSEQELRRMGTSAIKKLTSYGITDTLEACGLHIPGRSQL